MLPRCWRPLAGSVFHCFLPWSVHTRVSMVNVNGLSMASAAVHARLTNKSQITFVTFNLWPGCEPSSLLSYNTPRPVSDWLQSNSIAGPGAGSGGGSIRSFRAVHQLAWFSRISVTIMMAMMRPHHHRGHDHCNHCRSIDRSTG